MSAEEWRPVVGFDGYEVSDQGRVRSWKWKQVRVLTGRRHGRCGHVDVHISGPGGKSRPFVHRLVMEAFVGPKPPGLETRHLDGDPTNNRLSNLRYGTVSENQLDSVRHGTHVEARKTHCPKGHPYDEQNTRWYRKPNGGRGRRCRACVAEQARRYYAARFGWLADTG